MGRGFVCVALVLLSALAAHAELKRSVFVSYSTEKGPSKAVATTVTFIYGKELMDRGVRVTGESTAYGLIWFEKDEVAIIKIDPPPGLKVSGSLSFELIDYLCFFFPTGRVAGPQINAKDKRKWQFTAPWPVKLPQKRDYRLAGEERKAVKEDRRFDAAEWAMKSGDRGAAARHFNLGRRKLLGSRNREKAKQIGSIL